MCHYNIWKHSLKLYLCLCSPILSKSVWIRKSSSAKQGFENDQGRTDEPVSRSGVVRLDPSHHWMVGQLISPDQSRPQTGNTPHIGWKGESDPEFSQLICSVSQAGVSVVFNVDGVLYLRVFAIMPFHVGTWSGFFHTDRSGLVHQ